MELAVLQDGQLHVTAFTVASSGLDQAKGAVEKLWDKDLSGLLPGQTSLQLLLLESLLLLVLGLRKLPMPAAADVGDKSVFTYLAAQRAGTAPADAPSLP